MTKELLDNLEQDCKIIINDPFDNIDLIDMVLGEDVPELINFARRVSNAFETASAPATGPYFDGYHDALIQLRKEIYGR